MSSLSGKRVAVVGLGNLGSALLKYKGFKAKGFNICAAFDIDGKKVGRVKSGVEVFHINELSNIVRKKSIKIAILAVPAEESQPVADLISSTGIESVLNFTSTRLKFKKNMCIRDIDMTVEMERLSFMAINN